MTILRAVFIWLLVFVLTFDGYVFAATRGEIINHALDIASGAVHKSSVSQTQEFRPRSAIDLADRQDLPSSKGWQFFTHENPLYKFEMGTDSYDYQYTERIGVKDTATFYGIFASYTHRVSENTYIHSFKDVFTDLNKLNMYRLEGRFGTGSITYEGSGTHKGIQDYVTEIRGLAGYDISFPSLWRVTPMVGLGYRYLFDDFSTVPAQILDGQPYLSGYDRESTYLYAPVAIEIEKKFNPGWSIRGMAEVDFFFRGKQVSHFENMRDLNGNDPGYDPVSNEQRDGLGARASLRLSRETKTLDFFVEPFFRYWHIEDSKVELITIGGQPICSGGLCQAGAEPDNKTREIGVKVGLQY